MKIQRTPRQHRIAFEFEGEEYEVTFRIFRHYREYGIEDVSVVGIKDPSDALYLAADAAANEWAEGAVSGR